MTSQDRQYLDADALAQEEASDLNLLGIVAGRRKVAKALLAPTGPAKAVRDAWGPFIAAKRARRSGGA